jgi:hypothetical protein
VDLGLLGGDATFPDERLHQGVVLGQPGQHPGGQEVDPAVTDVEHGQLLVVVVADQAHDAHRGAHAPQLVVLGRPLVDAPVGPVHRRHQVLDRTAPLGRPHDLDGVGRRHLAGAVAAHPVGHHGQFVTDQEGVLVGGPHLTDQGGRPGAQAGHRTSSTTLPIWMRSPRRAGI